MLVSTAARADSVQKCVDASERGQKAQRAGRLVDARAAFLQCAAEKCPSVVKSACSEWLDQVNGALPSIVVAVTDAEHHDVVGANVTVDGKSVALGRAIELDAGPHAVAVDADDFEPANESIVAREHERGRTVTIVLVRHAATKEAGPASIAPPPRREGRPIRPVTWATGGLAVAGFVTFAAFGAVGRSQADDLRSRCAPYCTESERDDAHTKYMVADIALIAAVIMTGITVWTYLSTPKAP